MEGVIVLQNVISLETGNFTLIADNELVLLEGGSLWGGFQIGCGVVVEVCVAAAAIGTAGAACLTLGWWTAAAGGAALIVKGLENW